MGVVSCFLYFLLNQNANIRRKLGHETSLSRSRSTHAALPGSDAVWLFPVGKAIVDDSVCSYGFSLLSGAEGVVGLYAWRSGSALPAIL